MLGAIGSCPSGFVNTSAIEFSQDTSAFDEFCYALFSDSQAWMPAYDHCLSLNANLVSVHSQEEADFIVQCK